MALILVEELATIIAYAPINHAANAGDKEANEILSNVQAAFDEEFSIYCNELDYHMDEQCRLDLSYELHNGAAARLRKNPILGSHLTHATQIKPLLTNWS